MKDQELSCREILKEKSDRRFRNLIIFIKNITFRKISSSGLVYIISLVSPFSLHSGSNLLCCIWKGKINKKLQPYKDNPTIKFRKDREIILVIEETYHVNFANQEVKFKLKGMLKLLCWLQKRKFEERHQAQEIEEYIFRNRIYLNHTCLTSSSVAHETSSKRAS